VRQIVEFISAQQSWSLIARYIPQSVTQLGVNWRLSQQEEGRKNGSWAEPSWADFLAHNYTIAHLHMCGLFLGLFPQPLTRFVLCPDWPSFSPKLPKKSIHFTPAHFTSVQFTVFVLHRVKRFSAELANNFPFVKGEKRRGKWHWMHVLCIPALISTFTLFGSQETAKKCGATNKATMSRFKEIVQWNGEKWLVFVFLAPEKKNFL